MRSTSGMLRSLADPPREFTVVPLWFWNDALTEDELVRQIDDFQAHGVYGFMIHPRVGLPRDIGWMSERFLHFMHVAIEEARRRGLLVFLYDEGMYPSGASSGQVVAADPALQSRGLDYQVLTAGEEPALEPGHHLAAIAERASGTRLAFYDRPTACHIRGLHYTDPDEATRAEDEPTAADLLNPAAVACFIRLVYDRFAEAFGEHFGTLIRGIFTDEPNEFGGKCRREKGRNPGRHHRRSHPGRHHRRVGARRAAARLRLHASPAGALVRRRAGGGACARRLQPRHAAAPARDLLPAALRLVRCARHRPVRPPAVDGRPGLRALLPDPRAGPRARHDPAGQAGRHRRARIGAGQVRLLVDGSPAPPAVQRGAARRLRPHADLRTDEVADRLVPGAWNQPAVSARVLLLGARPPREGGAARRGAQQPLVGPLPALC